ncbi:MAG: hypothetical protein PHQ98_00380 [Candidatus ainarchaeum sp.]|nr:hypothetical protein [Candidatus ainarchaeum sp.]
MKDRIWNLIFILLVAFLCLEIVCVASNTKGVIPQWDGYHYLVFSKQISDAGGIPGWNFTEYYPEGRPYLYPPLIPIVISIVSKITTFDEYVVTYLLSITNILFFILIFYLILNANFKKEIAITASILLIFNSAFDLWNVSMFVSQTTEILLFFLVAHFLSRKRYVVSGIILGIAFFTHAHTPFLAILGLFILALIEKEKKFILTIITALFIGSPWLLRFLMNLDYISLGNKYLDWLFLPNEWTGMFLLYGFMTIITIILIILNIKNLIAEFKSNDFLKIVFFIFLPFCLTLYYIDRVFIYLAPIISIILSIALFKWNKKYIIFSFLFIAGISLLVYLIFQFQKPGFYQTQSFSLIIHLILFLIPLVLLNRVLNYLKRKKIVINISEKKSSQMIVIGKNEQKLISNIFIFIVICFFIFSVGSSPLSHIFSFFNGQDSLRQEKGFIETCQWIKENYPNGIIAQPATQQYLEQVMFYCNYIGIKSKTGPVVEFTKDGFMTGLKGATILIDGQYTSFFPNTFSFKKGNYAVYKIINMKEYPILINNFDKNVLKVTLNYMGMKKSILMKNKLILLISIDFNKVYFYDENNTLLLSFNYPSESSKPLTKFKFDTFAKISIDIKDSNSSILKDYYLTVKTNEDGKIFYPNFSFNDKYIFVPDMNGLVVVNKYD